MLGKLLLIFIFLPGILSAQNIYQNAIAREQIKELFKSQPYIYDRASNTENAGILNIEFGYLSQLNKDLFITRLDTKQNRLKKIEEALAITVISNNMAHKTHNSHLYVNLMDISEQYLNIYEDLRSKLLVHISTPIDIVIGNLLHIKKHKIDIILNTGLING